jgi:TonB family protein
MVRDSEYRPPSLLSHKGVLDGPMVALGLLAIVVAHIGIPILVLASQWLMVKLGLAIADLAPPPPPIDNVIAAEFVKLGKPFDPTKLPNRKVHQLVERKPDGIVISKDAQEKPKDEEKKERPKDALDALLDSTEDKVKDFAEHVEPMEEEGDPNGIKEGTATEAKAGDLYRGQLLIFFKRNFSVPNVVQDKEKKKVIVGVTVADDGALVSVKVSRSSGDPLFDQSGVDAVQALIDANAKLPEPPADLISQFYGTTLGIMFDGADAH